MQSSTGRNVLAAVAARLGAPGGADLRAEGVGDAPSRAEPTPLGAQAGAHRFSICYFTDFRNFPSLVLNRQAKTRRQGNQKAVAKRGASDAFALYTHRVRNHIKYRALLCYM